MNGPRRPADASIRLLGADDADAYRELMLEAYEIAADAYTTTAAERARQPHDWWVRRIADPAGGSAAFAAVASGGLVGAVALEYPAKPKTRHAALLIGMYVRPAARGLGLGRALLAAALQHAAARPGVRTMTLTLTEGNAPALRLYQAAGFRTWGTEPMAILTPGGFKGKVHMWRPLDRADAEGTNP